MPSPFPAVLRELGEFSDLIGAGIPFGGKKQSASFLSERFPGQRPLTREAVFITISP
jgi:hypothetical protein